MKIKLFVNERNVVAMTMEGRILQTWQGKLCEERATAWANLRGYEIDCVLGRMDT
jgi:hypothetical protein